jgi:redox-sensitive bicupin YhaK (pirin superfamily)
LPDLQTKNKLHQVLSPNADDAGVWVHQNAWFHMGTFNDGGFEKYTLKSRENGVYAFVIDGSFDIDGKSLNKRDALGIWETPEIKITATSPDSRILLIDVPMS